MEGCGRRRDLFWLLLFVFFFFFFFLVVPKRGIGLEILSKSKIEKCEKLSDSDKLNCNNKIVLNMAVPSGSSGGEASLVAELVEAEENTSRKMQTFRNPPVITVNKSAAYALYEITYIRDVPYKPVEFSVKTRKCEPDASAKVVKVCERLRDEQGHFIDHTQPICCPCGPWRRAPSSCGNVFDKLFKGKANTAHCLRFPGEWFHVFGIGRRSLGFSVRIEVKKGSKTSEVLVGPENRTVLSNDNFLRVNLIGDFVGYTSLPSFEDFYLVIPRQGAPGQPQNLGGNFSMWMLLERVRFTLDGLECNKIGVSYEAFRGQPNFCSSPFGSCLQNQLWKFWDADQNRISKNQLPQYTVERRFERINQHPDAGTHSFSIGITEVLNTNLLIELSADDIEYVYQRSPGQILSVTIPTFEALTQFGTATITTKNIGKLEASYSLTFHCSKGVNHMEEQFFILKPAEVATRSFKVYPTTDQAAQYVCAAILKDSDFNEIDRAECQFTTTATVLDNGTQITPDFGSTKSGINSFLESIEGFWNSMWKGLTDFVTGKTCRSKCSGFFDLSCHIQYICLSWIAMFALFLAIFPTVAVLLWLLHQKGLFDPLYDWWEDRFGVGPEKNSIDREYGQPPINRHHEEDDHHPHHFHHHHHNQEARHYRYHAHNQKRSNCRHIGHPELSSDHHHHKHHHHHHHHHHRRSHIDRHKLEHSDSPMDGKYESRMHRMERLAVKGLQNYNEEKERHIKRKHSQKQERLLSKMRTKHTRRE